ncbi:WASH complex subunit 2 [Uranotaenia lowii]|uniref:WASH complex subunit 2 n=1 Tax=Uranotaenia lowii TaxID=190385 RepID=UPI002479990D|nr:WASH complex subunit 2 [Uranotaenia lowii]XP_055596432.1 WASH complex subunit 2 [Uranotaenia lowii]
MDPGKMDITPEELRKRIPNWSLESDGQLLQYMVKISKNLEEKCKQTQENMNRMLMQGEESHIRFANASNNFNGIQQSKFVENRVEDDDESFYSVREEIEEPGEKLPHAEIFQMAVERSVNVMYRCFEKVTVELDSDSESDDEEEAAARNTVLRAIQKYPYIHRPLPHLIGSAEWRDNWHVGLIDSEEESETETKDQYSDSSDSDGMLPSRAESNNTPSESEGSVWGIHSDPRRRAPSMDPSISEDTLSIHSTSSSIRPASMRGMIGQQKVAVLPGPSFKPPVLFPDRPPDDTTSISSRSRVPNLFEESDEDESTPIHRPTVAPVADKQNSSYFRGNQPERRTINLFSDEPPPTNSCDPTTIDSQVTQTRKPPVNLFIDSDDEENMFNNNPSKATSVYQNEPPDLPPTGVNKGSNMFDESSKKIPPSATISFEKNNNTNEILADDEDIFVPVQRSINGAEESKRTTIQRITNLFDDEAPIDDFDEIFKPKSTTVRKIPGAKLVLPVSTSGPKKEEKKPDVPKEIEPIVASPPRKVNLFDDEGDDEDILSPKPTREAVPPKTGIVKQEPRNAVNLFNEADDNHDDIFSNVFNKKGNPIESSRRKVNLFGDDLDDVLEIPKPNLPELANVLAPAVTPSEIKVSEQFAQNNEFTEEVQKPVEERSSIRAEILKKKSIFDSDSEEGEDFLSETKPPLGAAKETSQEPPKTLNADKASDTHVLEQKLIETATAPSGTKVSEQPARNKECTEEVQKPVTDQSSIRAEILKKKSIFDSDSDEGEDFLNETKPPSEVIKETPQPPPRTLDADKASDTYTLEQKVIETAKDERSVSNDQNNKPKIKPEIPDEPPELDSWEETPPEDNYPHVSNDIEYFLTTNEVTSNPVEASPEKSLNSSKDENVNRLSNSANKTLIPDQIEHNDPQIAIATPIKGEMLPESNKSALNFSPIGLFSDLPPPDDDFCDFPSSSLPVYADDEAIFESKPLPSGENSTGPTVGGNSNLSKYLFMDDDGPPPDDTSATRLADIDEVDKVKVNQIQNKESKSLSSPDKLSALEANAEKSRIHRLSARVNINVNALLPGAKRPPQSVTVQPEEKEESANTNSASTPVASVISRSESESNRLVGPNKTRAKIQVKRKPSSRQHRRAVYENSLPDSPEISATTSASSSEPATVEPNKEVRVVVGSEFKAQHVEITAAHLTVEQLLSSDLTQKLSQPKLSEYANNDDNLNSKTDISNSILPKTLRAETKSSSSDSMKLPINSLISQNNTKLFSDEDSDDDLFGSKTTRRLVNRITDKAVKPSNLQPPVSSSVSHAPTSVSIFEDSEDDDLFSSKSKSRDFSSASSKVNAATKMPTAISDKIQATNHQQTKSLFGSDDESDGDDLFGGSKKQTKKPVASTGLNRAHTNKAKSKPAIESKSIFEDDDDDDDLFSGAIAKSIPKPPSSNKPTNETVSYHSKPVADDPLTKLLGGS